MYMITYQGKFGSKHVSMVANYPATSGLANHQNADEQGGGDLGPVPGGDYKINLTLDFLRKAPVSDGLTTESHGVELLPWGNGYLYSGWGQWRARLEALPGTDLRGRDGLFYLHDSYKGYTHGCVETNTALYYDLFRYRKTQESIKVRIAYPGPNSSTLGNTQQFPPPWWDGSNISYDANGIPYPRAATGKFPDPTKL